MNYSERPSCDEDGHGEDDGLRLLLLGAVLMAVRALPPQTNRRRMNDKRKGAQGENNRSSASCKDAELHCVLSTCTFDTEKAR